MSIYSEIKKLRKKINLSQVEFSKRVGIGLRCLREIEQGKPTIRLDKINQVLNFLGFKLIIVRRNSTDLIEEDYNKFSYSQAFSSELKLKIRKRDKFQCRICHMKEEEHFLKYKNVLNVHHIDYDKKNSVETNLITLCSKCHGKTKKNKSDWIMFFKLLISRIY